MKKRCIIVGAGELTVSKIPVEEEDLVIAADGGYAYCRRLGIRPDLILGDFDSIDCANAELVKEIRETEPERVITLPVEKDDTDMLAALKEGLRRGCDEFLIYAGMGGRFSHTLANVQCLNFLKEQGADGRLMEEKGMALLLRDETITFDSKKEGLLSLFSLGERAVVTIRNMKYPLDKAVVTNSLPIGVSNAFIGEEASITAESGTLLLLVGEL